MLFSAVLALLASLPPAPLTEAEKLEISRSQVVLLTAQREADRATNRLAQVAREYQAVLVKVSKAHGCDAEKAICINETELALVADKKQ